MKKILNILPVICLSICLILNTNVVYARCYAGIAFDYISHSPGTKENECIMYVNSAKLPNPNSENFNKEVANFKKKLVSYLLNCKYASKGMKFFRFDIYDETVRNWYYTATSSGNCGVQLSFYISKDGKSCRYHHYYAQR